MNIRFCISLLTKYFALDQYEKETDSTGNVRELYYISGADGVVAVLEKKNNQDSIFYIHKDYLGSYEVISNQNGTVKERYNFDPCLSAVASAKAEGRRRNPADWSYNNIAEAHFLDRGFTGHEHLDKFGLINMNGRVFDPLMAMFLSPDNFVQSPDLTQNLNRYTYCLNNPLKYVDPSGMTYFKLNSHWQWESFEYNPFMGDNFRTVSGGGINPERLNGTYRYNRNSGQYENNIGERVTWDEVYGNYVVPNSEFSIQLSGILSKSIINDPAVLPQTKEDYQKLADNYNNDKTLVEGNNLLLAEKFKEVFYMTLGNLNLCVLTTNSGTFGMTSKGIFYDFSENSFVGGYVMREGSGWGIHISPFALCNNVNFKAIAGHELIHLYHYNKTSYSLTYSEMVAYKYTVDVYNSNKYYNSANQEMSIARSLGYWSSHPEYLVSDHAYVWVWGNQ